MIPLGFSVRRWCVRLSVLSTDSQYSALFVQRLVFFTAICPSDFNLAVESSLEELQEGDKLFGGFILRLRHVNLADVAIMINENLLNTCFRSDLRVSVVP